MATYKLRLNDQEHELEVEELDGHFQLTFYGVLLRKLYPHIKNFEVGIYYARHGFLAVSERTSQQLDECEHQMELRVEQIKKLESFDPIGGEHCTICDAISICPLALDISEAPQAIITKDQAQRAAGRLRVLKLVEKALGDKLKAFAGEHGAIESGPGYMFGFRPTTSFEYPISEIGAKLAKYKYAIDPFLRADKVELKKLLNKIKRSDPDAYADIMSVVAKNVSTSFRGFKSAGDDDDEETT